MASVGGLFAANVYDEERADRMMGLAAELAALAEGAPAEEVRNVFLAEPWLRFSPAIGVDAAVFDRGGRILLVRLKDGSGWAMPGGLAEIGETPAETVLRELWEEAGLRGRAARLLGRVDARRWGSRARAHLVHLVFAVECAGRCQGPASRSTRRRSSRPSGCRRRGDRGTTRRCRR